MHAVVKHFVDIPENHQLVHFLQKPGLLISLFFCGRFYFLNSARDYEKKQAMLCQTQNNAHGRGRSQRNHGVQKKSISSPVVISDPASKLNIPSIRGRRKVTVESFSFLAREAGDEATQDKC